MESSTAGKQLCPLGGGLKETKVPVVTICVIASIAGGLILLTSPSAFSIGLDLGSIGRKLTVNPLLGNHRKSEPGSICYMTANINMGRLGNHMFVYATLRGLSEYCGCISVILPTDKGGLELAKYFRLRPGIITNDTQITSLPYDLFRYVKCCIFNPTIMSRCDNGTRNHTHLAGYLQSFRYFDHIRDKLKKEFVPKAAILTEAKAAMAAAIGSVRKLNRKLRKPTIIGIHARRGDMAKEKNIKAGRNTPNGSYYINAMEFYKRRYRNDVIFLLVTNDPEWARLNVGMNRTDVVIFDGNDAITDITILSLCDHTTMSIGSFGWWGSYLAGGTTVYFGDHPIPGTRIATYYNKTDYYPPDWIPMT